MYFKKADIIIYGLILVFFITVFLLIGKRKDEKAEYVEIYHKSKLVQRYKLTEKKQIIKLQSKLGEEEILIENNEVKKIKATCPGHDCMNSIISKSGQMIICVPNEQLIKLSGKSSELDYMLY